MTMREIMLNNLVHTSKVIFLFLIGLGAWFLMAFMFYELPLPSVIVINRVLSCAVLLLYIFLFIAFLFSIRRFSAWINLALFLLLAPQLVDQAGIFRDMILYGDSNYRLFGLINLHASAAFVQVVHLACGS